MHKLFHKITRVLPAPLLRLLRRRYYLKVVKNHRAVDWEWASCIQPLIASGSDVLDVGANVGYLTGLFARWVGPGGRVVAIEPVPATYDSLQYSMKCLFPDTVVTRQCCLSDTPGNVMMAVPQYADGRENYYESRIVGDEGTAAKGGQFSVKAITLDELLGSESSIQPVFIKIDVEGHESAVIHGGAAYLAKHHPPLLIEVSGDPDREGSAAAQLFSTLDSLGYSPYLIKNNKLQVRSSGDASVDYLFLYKT